MPPHVFKNYIFKFNGQIFDGEPLNIKQSKNGTRYWANSSDPNTNFPISFAAKLYNNGNSFQQYNENTGMIYEWDRVRMSYSEDIGTFKIKIFLKWRTPRDRHWHRVQ